MTARVNGNESITQADVYSQLPYEIPIEEGSIFLPAAARVIQPNEDLFTYIARVQLLAIEAATISEGNHTYASKRLGYRRPSLVALKQKLRNGTYRGGKTRTPPSICLITERSTPGRLSFWRPSRGLSRVEVQPQAKNPIAA